MRSCGSGTRKRRRRPPTADSKGIIHRYFLFDPSDVPVDPDSRCAMLLSAAAADPGLDAEGAAAFPAGPLRPFPLKECRHALFTENAQVFQRGFVQGVFGRAARLLFHHVRAGIVRALVAAGVPVRLRPRRRYLRRSEGRNGPDLCSALQKHRPERRRGPTWTDRLPPCLC